MAIPVERFTEVRSITLTMMSLEQARQFTSVSEALLVKAIENERLRCYVRQSAPSKQAPRSYRKGWWFERQDLAEWMAAGKPTDPLAAPAVPAQDATLGGSDAQLVHQQLADVDRKASRALAILEALARDLGVNVEGL